MKFPKILLLTALFSLCAVFVSCKKESIPLNDGVFTGTAAGRNGDIVVSVKVTDGKVSDASILSDSETPEIASPAKESIISSFLKDGSTDDIDTVSGATITSNAILSALDEALEDSRGRKKTEILTAGKMSSLPERTF